MRKILTLTVLGILIATVSCQKRKPQEPIDLKKFEPTGGQKFSFLGETLCYPSRGFFIQETLLLYDIKPDAESDKAQSLETFTGIVTSETYENSDCTEPSLNSESYSFSLIKGKAMRKPTNAYEADIKITYVMVKPRSQAMVDEYNQSERCGFKDWALNVVKSSDTCVAANIYTNLILSAESVTLGESEDANIDDGSLPEKRQLGSKKEVFLLTK